MATTSIPVPPTAIASPSRKGRMIIIVLLVLGVVAGAAGAAYYYFVMRASPAAAVAKPPAAPIFVALDPFTVNLQPNGRSRFLHVAVSLKVSDTKSQAQIVQYLPEVRSRVLTALSNRNAESLTTADEKTLLAAEILAALNKPFLPNQPPQTISSVMFTTFMLQ